MDEQHHHRSSFSLRAMFVIAVTTIILLAAWFILYSDDESEGVSPDAKNSSHAGSGETVSTPELNEEAIDWRVDNLIDYMPTEKFNDTFDKHRHLVIEDRDSESYVVVRIPLLELLAHVRVPDGTAVVLRFFVEHAESRPLIRLYVNDDMPGEAQYDYVYNSETKTISVPPAAKARVDEVDDEEGILLTVMTPLLTATETLELRVYGGAGTQTGGYSTKATGVIAIKGISLGILAPQ